MILLVIALGLSGGYVGATAWDEKDPFLGFAAISCLVGSLVFNNIGWLV